MKNYLGGFFSLPSGQVDYAGLPRSCQAQPAAGTAEAPGWRAGGGAVPRGALAWPPGGIGSALRGSARRCTSRRSALARSPLAWQRRRSLPRVRWVGLGKENSFQAIRAGLG